MTLLQTCLTIFKTLLPLGLACYYASSKDKTRQDRILKFLIIRVLLSMIQYLTFDIIGFTYSIGKWTLLILYIYLSLFHYMYSQYIFDATLLPLAKMVRDWQHEIKQKLQKEKQRLKTIEQTGGSTRFKKRQEYRILSTFQNLFYDTFDPDVIFLIK